MTIKIQTDSNGFLIGGKVEDWRAISGKWNSIEREVRAIRAIMERGGRSAAGVGVAGVGMGRRATGSPGLAPQSSAAVLRAASADATSARAMAASMARGTASPRQRPIPGAPAAATALRDSRGRFVAGQARASMAAGGNSSAESGGESGTSKGKSRFGAAFREFGRGNGDLSQVDPAAAAAQEIRDVVEPFGRAFGKLFGRDPEKKKAVWFKRVWETLKTLPAKIGERISMSIPADRSDGSGSLLSAGVGALGLVRGALGMAVKRVPFIGAALGLAGGIASDRALASDGSEGRGGRRLANAGRTTGNVGGAVLGGIAGFAIGGPIGAALGATVGPMIVRAMSDTLSPVIGEAADFIASASRSLSDMVMNGLGWLGSAGKQLYEVGSEYIAGLADKAKNSRVVKGGTAAYSKAIGTSADYMKKLGILESSDNPKSSVQRDKFMTTGGKKGSTASGRYQFLDSTFAEQLAKNGADIPAAAGLMDSARAYNADKRGARAKGRDPAYAKLIAAKLDPAVADPLAAAFTAQNRKRLAATGIANPTDAQLYSVHLTGDTKAAEAMARNPSGPVSDAFTQKEIANNYGLLGNKATVADAFGGIGAKFNMPVAMPKVSSRAVPSMPAMPAIPMPEMPRQPQIISSLNTTAVVGPQADVGQDMRDRNLANIQTGGMGK